jgi:hypothetical protein
MTKYSKLRTDEPSTDSALKGSEFKKLILVNLEALRDKALDDPNREESSGVNYCLDQLEPPIDNPLRNTDKKSQEGFFKDNARKRVDLHRQTALAILEAAGIKRGSEAYQEASRKLSTAQMKSHKGGVVTRLSVLLGVSKSVPNVSKVLRETLNKGKDKKEKLSKKHIKSMLKASEGIMMRRRVPLDQKLYVDESSDNASTVVQRVRLDAIEGKLEMGTEKAPIKMESALSKGDQAKDRPPRNLRSCDVKSKLGTNQYLVSSYLLEGTDVTGLKALSGSKAEAMNALLGSKLPNRVNYVTLIDSQDHNASWIINLFKGDNELKLEKKAGENDGPEIIRMNTTQKGSWGSVSKLGNMGLLAVGVLATIATVALAATGVGAIAIGLGAAVAGGTLAYRTGLSIKTANPDLYNRAEVVKGGLVKLSNGLEHLSDEKLAEKVDQFNEAFGANANKENLGKIIESKIEELGYLTKQLKAVENGQLNPGNRWKPVLEQMITARTGAVSLMGCKSGKDRAFGVTALTMAMEKKVADCIDKDGSLNTELLNNIDLEKDPDLAGYLKEVYMSDYGPKVGADNCDGAYGTKDPQNFFPDGLMGALSPDDQSALKAFMEGSNKLAKLNGSAKFDAAFSEGVEAPSQQASAGVPPPDGVVGSTAVVSDQEPSVATKIEAGVSVRVGQQLGEMKPPENEQKNDREQDIRNDRAFGS